MSKFFTTEIGNMPEYHPGLRMFTVKSEALGRRADITVFDGSATTLSPVTDLPVVILLHGVYGSHFAWLLNGRAHEVHTGLMMAGQCGPMLLVMPSDGMYGDGSAYLPHHDADYEAWIVEDVLDVVRENYPAVTAKSKVFITGLSMGGYGALRLGARYPDVFAGFSGMSSITGFGQLQLFVSDFELLEQAVTRKEDVLDVVVQQQGRLAPFRFDCGSEDLLIQFNRELHRKLDELGIAHEYREHPGAHLWTYWQEHLADQLRFFSGLL